MTEEERIMQLNQALVGKTYVCSSQGVVQTFPPSLRMPYQMNGVGLIVCLKGTFRFLLNREEFTANAGETVFVPEYASFMVLSESADLEIVVLVYQVDPIRDIMGNLVLSMFPYSRISEASCYVWKTGEEDEVMKYMALLDSTLTVDDDAFNLHERKLLLLALTHRLCSIYSRKLFARQDSVGHKHEVFMKLIRLVEQHYMQERGVEFYADKLCLTPKYLSALSKVVSGYTVQELVFKAIIRKSISLLQNTQKSVQDIADEFHFPNASYFGTFFKKQTGMSPQQFRKDCASQSDER